MTAEQYTAQGDDLLTEVCTALLAGPRTGESKRVISADTKLLSVVQEGSLVTVNLSKEFENATTSDRLWSRYTIVTTLCELNGVDKVQLLIDGQQLISEATGLPAGPLGADDVIDRTQSATQQTSLKLYFADAGTDKLVAETITVSPADGQSMEKLVVNRLINGPQSKNLIRTIPQGTRLLTVDTREGICFVNMSSEFVTRHSGGSTSDFLTVYSLVNSLCELPDIDKVQILVDGKMVDVFNHMEIGQPLSFDPTMVKN